MHWADETAQELINMHPNKKEFVCASGISPSGTVHAGNFREYITTYFVVESLKKLGKSAKMIYSWDDFDRLRKVPKNIQIPGFEQHIGKPYSDIPSPFPLQGKTFAECFEKEFEIALERLNTPAHMIRQNEMYKGGKYVDQIIFCIKNRKKIYDIIMSFKTQNASEEERENFYPVSVYCKKCLKDDTTILSVSSNSTKLTYKCTCGHTETVDLKTFHLIKLVWKVDWAMRWVYESVDFEPGGKDHSTVGGSYDVSSKIIREVFGKKPPLYRKYGWLGILGLGEMHSSSGLNISPLGLLEVYEPEVFLWLYAKYDTEEEFNFAFDQTIQRQYSEFDKMLSDYIDGTIDEYNKRVIELALNGKQPHKNVSFGTLTNLAPIINYNRTILAKVLEKMGLDFDEAAQKRFDKVEFWLKNFVKPEPFKLLKTKNQSFWETLDLEEKNQINKVANFLKTENLSDAQIQQGMYDIVNNPHLSKKENIAIQQTFFKNLYMLLFGTEKGPRLYLFFAFTPNSTYLPLLSF